MLEALRKVGISPVAVTGGIAFSIWVTPRATRDFDLCATIPAAAVDKLLVWYDGTRTGAEKIPSLIRFSFAGWAVDLFAVDDAYDEECMRRAVETDFLGVPLRVVTPEDLLIHKVIKLREDKRKVLQDASDIRSIVETCRIDEAYLHTWLPTPDAELLAHAAIVDEEELVARLKKL